MGSLGLGASVKLRFMGLLSAQLSIVESGMWYLPRVLSV
ncbi:hypothetical protein JCM19237_4481 [Photobacterium aphoticum]|uniref:Uncharacterized protein n=1 Tax=Photobacterium aphoticum TaxID=754436 RepID=A0A090R148_9GAMM|nr:hypothetical protein JCM19237_4481 [Photobacterium aphoticum]